MTFGVDDVVVRFGSVVALDRVSLAVDPGAVTGVIGEDGSGKTTLLRLLAGAIAPASGAVRRPDARRIGYLPAGSGTYADLTVDENLRFFARAYGVAHADVAGRTEELLERMGLAQVRARLAGALSGGMRQKLGVVASMLHAPDLLVLDEPTTGVDPVSRADVWWLIARAARLGAAVVVATTYVNEAARASSVALLETGSVVVTGAPDDVVGRARGRVVRLGAAPVGARAACAWQRGREWRLFVPDGATGGDVVEPDLTDAVIVAALEREQSPRGSA